MNTLGYVIVFVSDMDKSVAFYRDVLGFPVRHQSQQCKEFDTGGRPSPCIWRTLPGHPHFHATMPAGHCHVG